MAVLQRIAVADDEPIIRDFYCRVLVRRGLTIVVIAKNGEELVDGCRSEKPDLIICDVRMPVLDGLSAIDLVSRFRPTPAIIISALSESEWCHRAGSQYVLVSLTKPVSMHDVEQSIARAEQRLDSHALSRARVKLSY